MIRDEKATKRARELHRLGVTKLRELLFEGTKGSVMRLIASQRPSSTRPVRLRPGVPPWRTEEMRRKHVTRKRFKAARRRNREAKRR